VTSIATTTSADLAPLSPTRRTQLIRGKEHAHDDRAALRDVLGASLICHFGVVVHGVPRVLPTTFGVDWEGTDPYGSLYLHGSVASASLRAATEQTVCVTVTALDGLVLARSGFNHSANYRCAMVFGRPRLVEDESERLRALDLIVDHLVPGRAATLRPATRKELAATRVVSLSLEEASVKSRAGDPVDEPRDVEAGIWGGVLPFRLVAEAPITSADAGDRPVPPDVADRAEALALTPRT
jgi:hypothetical protein